MKEFFSEERAIQKESALIAEVISQDLDGLHQTYKHIEAEKLAEKLELLKEDIHVELSGRRNEDGSLTTLTATVVENLMIEVFTLAGVVVKRVLGFKPFQTQYQAAWNMNLNHLIEMKTGEGKTVVAALVAIAKYALGEKVHVITANNYLAQRDYETMKEVFEVLGIKASSITSVHNFEETKNLLDADIVYSTTETLSNIYMFSMLSKNKSEIMLEKFPYAIIDEADTVLIDMARNPLTLTAPTKQADESYYQYPKLVEQIEVGKHYTLQNENLSAYLEEAGVEKVEEILGIENLFSPEHIEKHQKLIYALLAKEFLHKDVDYVVVDGEISRIDKTTGRILEHQTFAEGVLQSVEAKEGLPLSQTRQIVCSMTYQSLFEKYKNFTGMSGSMIAERTEFQEVYGKLVIEIPTNLPIARIDHTDYVYRSQDEKQKGIVSEIVEMYKLGRPVLVGAYSPEETQVIGDALDKEGIPYNLLDAKNHRREAEIIKDAGQKGVVTLTTNMAGRGTDIILGEGVNELGGLHVIITTRHESERMDLQLRGRAGRQGDNGSSRLFVSLEDDLIKQFGGDTVKETLERFLPNKVSTFVNDKGETVELPIESKQINKLVNQMQIQSSAASASHRRFIKQYGDVFSSQQDVIHESRLAVLKGGYLERLNIYKNMLRSVIDNIVSEYENSIEVDEDENQHDYYNMTHSFNRFLGTNPLTVEEVAEKGYSSNQIREFFFQRSMAAYDKKREEIGSDTMSEVLKQVILGITDSHWFEHIEEMEHAKKGLGLSVAGSNPFFEFTVNAHSMYEFMMKDIEESCVYNMGMLRLKEKEE